MLELILVRHGETESNKKGAFMGWTDSVFNETGKNQAEALKLSFKGQNAEIVYTSPLKRAFDTAKAINEALNVGLISIDDIKERNFGIWDNLTREEIATAYPEEYEKWMINPNFNIIGSESIGQVNARVCGFIDNLLSSYSHGSLIIVTHLGCIRLMLAYLLGMNIEGGWRFRVDNGSISRVMVNDEKYAYLTKLNV